MDEIDKQSKTILIKELNILFDMKVDRPSYEGFVTEMNVNDNLLVIGAMYLREDSIEISQGMVDTMNTLLLSKLNVVIATTLAMDSKFDFDDEESDETGLNQYLQNGDDGYHHRMYLWAYKWYGDSFFEK